MTVKTDEQGTFTDRHVELPELEELIEEMESLKADAKAHNKARRQVLEIIKGLQLQPDERIIVGQYAVTGVARAGGGFNIPKWERVVPRIGDA